LDRLAHEGLLKPLPAVGFVVCEFTLADIWDAIEIRGVLEGTAARFAAERLENPSELVTLKGYCDAMDSVHPTDLRNFVSYLEVNEAFHAELRNLAKSPMLARAIESIGRLPFASPGALVFGEAEPAHSQQASEIAQEHHRGIVEAIGNREGARAESLAREHSRVARKNLARALQDRDLLKHVPGGSLIKFPTTV
jgi:GntR family transcriptional regulator of vanillate catabolism